MAAMKPRTGDGPLEVGRGPVRTGVTAILPRGRDGVGIPCAAGFYSLNGNGEMTGTTWIEEVGALSMPIGITNTHSVGAVHEGIVRALESTGADLIVMGSHGRRGLEKLVLGSVTQRVLGLVHVPVLVVRD